MLSKNNPQILVVDDSLEMIEILQRNLTTAGYKIFTASSAPDAVRVLESTSIDLVITDLKMPKVNGLDLIRHVKENYKDTEIILITGYATIEGAVKAIKTGAEEYLPKPFTIEELLTVVKRTLDKLMIQKKGSNNFEEKLSSQYGIIGDSEVMRKIFALISKVSLTSVTTLITGESGTGKELVARAIHYSGKRASAPFVPINCGGIPEELLESELFGHVKGAFTGAVETRAGFFQIADGGSIFLDEISETSLTMQVKLLRVLQDKEIFMIGSRKPRKVDIRIIAATNKDLYSMVKKEYFREDLYYRLNVINIELPPLRERGDDIILLTKYFTSKFSEEIGKPTPEFSTQVLKVFKEYYWAGNVRELANVIQQLVVMIDRDVINVTDLPYLMRFSLSKESGFDKPLVEIEAEYIRNVLNSVNGNKTQAAKILGIDRKTLRTKLKQFVLGNNGS
jgi:DNA-binding NtrC family response regulator